MKRKLLPILVAATVGLESILAACSNDNIPGTKYSASAVQQSIIHTFTETDGQAYFDKSVAGDIVFTRYFIYQPGTRQTGEVIRLEGKVRGFALVDGKLNYWVKSFSPDETLALELFAEKAIGSQHIDYGTAPHKPAVLVNISPVEYVPVGFTGNLPVVDFPRSPVPFELAKRVSENPNAQGLPAGLAYSPDISLLPQDSLSVYQEGIGCLSYPVRGAVVLQQGLLDTNHPQNKALLDQIRKELASSGEFGLSCGSTTSA